MRSEQPAWRNWFNFALVVATLCVMLGELAPPAIAFLVATVLALVVNFPRVELQWDTVARHAPSAISMVAILFAAGCFTGLMRGTGMITALAQAAAHLLPAGAARLLPLTVSILAMPLSLLFDPDSFYFGILPLLGGVAQHGGVPAIDVGRAAILGQMTTGFPVSPMTPATFLLVGLAKVDLGDHQRYAHADRQGDQGPAGRRPVHRPEGEAQKDDGSHQRRQQHRPDHRQARRVRQHRRAGKAFAPAEQERDHQGGNPRGGVDHDAAREIERAEPGCQPAPAPYPMRRRSIDHQAP